MQKRCGQNDTTFKLVQFAAKMVVNVFQSLLVTEVLFCFLVSFLLHFNGTDLIRYLVVRDLDTVM